MNLLNFTKVIMGNLFSKPATRPYPETPREYPQRTRGKVMNNIGLCVFCGLCAKKCPTGAIAVDRAGKSWSIQRFNCIQCGSCVECCPKKCLSMEQHYPQPGAEKRTDTFVQSAPEEAPAPKE